MSDKNTKHLYITTISSIDNYKYMIDKSYLFPGNMNWGKKSFADNKSTTIFACTKNGMWRSLVAHSSGGRGVASSNLVIPTVENKGVNTNISSFLFFMSTT